MCIRAGNNELESVKNLMGMSLMAVIAESLDVDIEAIEEYHHLVHDLKMDAPTKRQLELMIAEVFDGLAVDLNKTVTVEQLLNRVVMSEFADDGIRQYVGLDAITLTDSAA